MLNLFNRKCLIITYSEDYVIKLKMVYCFAYDCKNDYKSGKSTFAFPPNLPAKDELRRKWIAVCNRRKVDIENATYRRLCEDHFSPDAFTKCPELARHVGYRLSLKPNAIPDPERFTRISKNLAGEPVISEPLSDRRKLRQRKILGFQMEQNIEACIVYGDVKNSIYIVKYKSRTPLLCYPYPCFVYLFVGAYNSKTVLCIWVIF